MRITNGMIAANTLRNINKAANRMAAANEAVATNMKIQLASDDPTVATRAVTYRSYVSQVKQYQDNVDSAQGWQKATDDALSDLSDDITTLKTLTNKASSTGTLSDSDLADIKARVKTLMNDIVTVMNSDYSGSYIFGGYSTGESPYEVVTTDIGETVTYKDKYLSLGGVVSADISNEDIISFYSDNFNTTTNTDNVYDSLQSAATSALTAYTTAKAAADAAPADTALAAKAAKAKVTSDALASSVTSYGGATTLKAAAADAKTDYTTIAGAVTTYGGTTTLTDAAASALTAYNTAQAAADAAPANTTLAAAATAAKTVSDTLAAAVTSYGSVAATTTLTDVSANALIISNTLATAVTNSEQNITYNIGFSSEATVNIEGQDVTGEGSGSNLFDTIEKLLLALDGDTSYKTASLDASGNVTVITNTLDLSDLLDEFSADLDRVTVAQAKLGANMNIVNNASDRLDSAYEAYKALMTDNENIDTAAATTELTSAEYTYEAALAVGAKVTTKSLIDYIA